ncbi:response regulator [Candidatus Nitrospira bockiana]
MTNRLLFHHFALYYWPMQVRGSALVVDDDEVLLQALPDTLQFRFPSVLVETCASAEAAINRLHQRPFSVVLTDLVLPGQSGLALLSEARKVRPNTPVIVLSGRAEQRLAEQAMHDGAFDVLWKPVEREELVFSFKCAMMVFRLREKLSKSEATAERLQRFIAEASRQGERERHSALLEQTLHSARQSYTLSERALEGIKTRLKYRESLRARYEAQLAEWLKRARMRAEARAAQGDHSRRESRRHETRELRA